MKKTFLFVFFLYLSNANLFGQHRGDNWCFSDSCGISFLSGSPVNIPSNLGTISSSFPGFPTEATASISNEAGNLLFYANGNKVWNAIGDTLETNLLGMGCGQDATNGCLFLPFPGKEDSVVAYFYVWLFPIYHPKGLYYTLLNTNLNGGLGDILTSTIYTPAFLTDSVSEQLTSIKHANGRDWWIIFKTGKQNDYFKILLGLNGIEKVDSQNVGMKINLFNYGEISSNPQGDLIGSVHFYARQIELFRFDRCSGEMTLIYDAQLDDINGAPPYGCSFSPDGRNFYYSVRDTIYQIHINNNFTVNNKVIIASHPFTVFPPSDSIYDYWQHELGPDGKIYIICSKESTPYLNYTYRDKNLCVINNPNGIGAACDFQPWSYYLGGNKVTLGLPNMPNYNLGKLVGSPCDTLTSIQNENLKTKSIVRIFPNPATEQLTIDNGEFTITEIEITDVMGRIIYKEQSHSHLSIIHCQLFSAGIYFVKVYMNDGNVEVKKFVKEQQ
ncbi:hypothetical protein LBMAG27_08980 [Bacteroidota bacterium]|nr:hypothetical protein LBMAG27_08980 [Bacteroidota bacterium]